GDKLDEVNILHISVGGGIIQREVAQRGGEKVDVGRASAIKKMLQFIAENAEVEGVVATGHDRSCGAEAFCANGKSWPERLDCAPGADAEQEKMAELIREHAERLIPDKWRAQGIVATYLVAFGS